MQRPGGPKLRRIVFPNLNVRRNRGGDGDDADDENDLSLEREEDWKDWESKTREKLS